MTGIYSKVLNRSYAATGIIGRYSGMNIGTEYSLSYGYDTYGRGNSLANGSDTFSYSYLADSDLLSGITYPNTITVSNSYEANRDLLTSVENKYGVTTVSKFQYVNDALARRTSAVRTGTGFAQNNFYKWDYNDRSEVTTAPKYLGTDIADLSNPVTTYNYGFNYDNIGNRLTHSSTETGTPVTRTYSSNSLNQYTTIDNPSVTPTYNDDGCVTSDGAWTYTWDAENRMSSSVNGTRTLEYVYDFMSRRVEKKVIDSGSTSKYLRFVYDAYKLIEELDASNDNAIKKKIVWNYETPFSITDTALNATYYYVLDANKNVSDLIDASGNIVAHYEYSPFGKITSQSGSYADENPLRFSSEYFDSETGLVYYNYRYYSPELGRWLSRDPIEEEGGYNLYSMIDNNCISVIDLLGLMSCDDCKKFKNLLDNFNNSLRSDSSLQNDLANEINDLAIDRFAIGLLGIVGGVGKSLASLGKAGVKAVGSKAISKNASRQLARESLALQKQAKQVAGESYKTLNRQIGKIDRAIASDAAKYNTAVAKQGVKEGASSYVEAKAQEKTGDLANSYNNRSDSLGNRYLDALNDGEDTINKLEDTSNNLSDRYNNNLKKYNQLRSKYMKECK